MKNHRSPQMWLIAQLLPLLQFPGMKNREDAQKYLQQLREQGEAPLPDKLLKGCKSAPEKGEYRGMPVFCFGEPKKDCPVVLYLHGGAFIYQMDPTQAALCDKLATERGTYVIAPVYPLAPHHTYEDAYRLIGGLYEQLAARYKQGITLLGDSAGASLAVGLSLQMAHEGKPRPKRLLLFSPWVDLEMSTTDYTPLQPQDPMLGAESLREMALSWAGTTDVRDYHISPINGDLHLLPPVDIHSGTREILFPDAKRFYHKLREAGVEATFTVGRKLTHDYIMIATPEQKLLIREMKL